MKIFWKQKIYYRTSSGKGFKKNPTEIKEKEIDLTEYANLTSPVSIRFWNGFCGGTCRAYYGYTPYGLNPIRIIRQNPDKSKKYVDTFEFKIN